MLLSLRELRQDKVFEKRHLAEEFMKKNNYQFLTQSLKEGNKGFYPFKTNCHFVDWTNQYAYTSWGLCEILQPNKISNLFFDLDGLVEIADEEEFSETLQRVKDKVRIDEFVEDVLTVLKPLLPESINYDVRKMDDSRLVMKTIDNSSKKLWKLSYHLIFNGIYFNDIATSMKAFVKECIYENQLFNDNKEYNFPKLRKNKWSEKKELFVDLAVYSKYRAMRISNVFKKWDNSEKSMDKKILDMKMEDLIQNLPSGIEDIPYTPISFESTVSKFSRQAIPSCLVENNDNNNSSMYTPMEKDWGNDSVGLTNAILQIKNILEEYADDKVSSLRFINGTNKLYVFTDKDIGRKCLCKPDTIHYNNNAMIYLYREYFVYKCFGVGCKSKVVSLKTDNSPETLDVKYNMNYFRKNFSFLNIESYDNEYVSSSLDFLSNTLAISSSMGSGKTTYVAKFLLKHKPESILFVTPRISLANSMYDSFNKSSQESNDEDKKYFDDLKLYTEKDVYGSNGTIVHKKIICQYESLYKLGITYDVIIIDELRSLLKSVISNTTNGENIQNNFRMLKFLLQKSRKTILLDADLFYDIMCPLFLKLTANIRFQNILTHWYTGSRFQRDVYFFFDRSKFLCEMINCAKNLNKKIVVCCGSRKDAYTLHNMFTSIDIKSFIYTRDTSDEIIETDLRNVEYSWSNEEIRVLIYTSKVLVGVDYNGDKVDTVFIWGKPNTATARELLQMAGRCRQINDKIYNVYGGTKDYESLEEFEKASKNNPSMITSFSQAMALCELAFEQKKKYFNEILKNMAKENDFVMENSKIYESPKLIKILMVTNFMETTNSSINILYEILQLCKKKNYSTYLEENEYTSEEIKNVDYLFKRAQVMTQDQDDEQFENAINLLLSEDFMISSSIRRVKRGKSTKEDKNVVRMYHLINGIMKKDTNSLISDVNLIKFLDKNQRQFYNLYGYLKYQHDINTLILNDILSGNSNQTFTEDDHFLTESMQDGENLMTILNDCTIMDVYDEPFSFCSMSLLKSIRASNDYLTKNSLWVQLLKKYKKNSDTLNLHVISEKDFLEHLRSMVKRVLPFQFKAKRIYKKINGSYCNTDECPYALEKSHNHYTVHVCDEYKKLDEEYNFTKYSISWKMEVEEKAIEKKVKKRKLLHTF